jgi:hypothetical protein
MISKGTTHNNGARLAAYMETSKDGERAELWELRGFAATTIKDAFRCVDAMAGATKAEQPFFHVQVRNREGEIMTRQQFEYAADRIERMLGLSGQPRAITFHTYEHNNDQHMHVAWSRIDQDTMTAKPLPFFKERLKKISRELELHFGLEPVTSRREGPIKYAPTKAQEEQARRLGLDAHELRNTIRNCWDRSDNGHSFQAALEHEGMTLAQGERRDFVVIDQRGGTHVLSKRILDVTAAKIRDRLSDISRDELPTAEMARAFLSERTSEQAKHPEKPAPVWDRDRDDRAWQDAVIDAAIEKEKIARECVEPGEREKRAAAGSRKKEKSARVERPLDTNAAEIRLAFSLSQSPEGFVRNLDECGFRLACVTRNEAGRSHRNAAFAKEAGRFAPEYREGEYVAINERGQVYSLNQRTIGKSREDIDAFMRTLDGTKIQGIDATQEQIAAYKRPAPAREMFPAVPDIEGQAIRMPSHAEPLTAWQQFGKASWEATQRDSAPEHMEGPSADIRTAYMRSDNARAFVAALHEKDIAVAIVTREDVTNSEIDRLYATNLSPVTPPKLREGDYVAVADNGRVYNLNYRTTGVSAERVQKFMSTLDSKEFQGVYAVLNTVQERAAMRDIERQAFRDLSAGKLKSDRDPRPTGRLGRKMRSYTGNGIKSPAAAGKKALRIVGKTLDVVSDAFASLFAPTLTPEQIHQGEIATHRREAEAENSIDFARYTGELAQQRQQQENDREAERQRHRDGGGRER